MRIFRRETDQRAMLHRRISRIAQPAPLGDRHFILRNGDNLSVLRISRRAQVGVCVAFVFGAAWLAHATYAYFGHYRIVSARDAVIAAQQHANLSLREDLIEARHRFTAVTDSLERNHKGLASIMGQNEALEGDIAKLRTEIARIERERDVAENDRIDLMQQISSMEAELHRAQANNQSLTAELEATGAQLAEAIYEGSEARDRHLSLNDRVAELQGRLSGLRESQTALVDRIADTSQAEITRLRDILATTGVKSELFGAVPDTAQGGPFEAADGKISDGDAETVETAMTDTSRLLDHLDGMQRLVRQLPLAAPLDYYYISSKYGERKDPINGRKAMHRGLDFGAKYKATVFSSAPGVVKYAGWKGRFGRFVEIDHGNGVVTRYGHLRRIHVKRGQKVDFRTKIGQMGSSGRSTGVHLHYEIHVNGKSVDPLKFLKAGRNVFKG